MAAWQCRFYIAPKENVLTFDKPNEDESFWSEERLSVDLFKSLEKYLPIQKSWCNDITQYGDLQETCIEILRSKNDKYIILIRLDLPKLTKGLYLKILDLILKSECMICVVETQKVYNGDELSLIQVIKESNAYRLGKKYNPFVASL